jgi:hypothetical protein
LKTAETHGKVGLKKKQGQTINKAMEAGGQIDFKRTIRRETVFSQGSLNRSNNQPISNFTACGHHLLSSYKKFL